MCLGKAFYPKETCEASKSAFQLVREVKVSKIVKPVAVLQHSQSLLSDKLFGWNQQLKPEEREAGFFPICPERMYQHSKYFFYSNYGHRIEWILVINHKH